MAKDDLIYRETAKRIIDSPRNKEQMLTMLNSIPQVDVKPIVRGKWISCEDDDLKISEYQCSICGYYMDDKTPFCQMCGSDMKKESEEEE